MSTHSKIREAYLRVTSIFLLLGSTLIFAAVCAAAQDSAPKMSIGDYVMVPAQGPVMSRDWQPIHVDKAPPYCKPCFFYAGDFDPNNSGSGGLWNANSGGIQGDVWTPFRVPKIVKIKGLLINIQSSGSGKVDNPTPYGVRMDVSSGNGGELVCSGSADATSSPTGRTGFGLTEYTVQIKRLAKACDLKKGVFWMNIEPQDSSGQLWYLSDVEPPVKNHCGPKNVYDDSFFNSSTFGLNFAPTSGSGGVCGSTGCQVFSVGVTCKKGEPGCPCKN